MKQIISYSLYGNQPIYTIGCVNNAKIKEKYFPGWEMWVYYNDTVPKEIVTTLKDLGVKLIYKNIDLYYGNSMWRFEPIGDSTIDYFISRDCDSRLSERDAIAIKEWIESGKDYHIIRDHPIGHWWVMNAGMWGSKGGLIPNIEEIYTTYIKKTKYGLPKTIDQIFLKDMIYPIAKQNMLLHDEFFNYENIGTPIKRDRKIDDFHFIGESIKEDDTPNGDQISSIIKLYN